MEVAARLPKHSHDARLRNRLFRHLPVAGNRGRDRAIRRRRTSTRGARECPRDRDVHQHRRLNRARRGDRRSAIEPGATFSPTTMQSCVESSAASEGRSATPPATASIATFDPLKKAIIAGVRTIGLEARIGIHVGECEIHDGKVTGLAVVAAGALRRRQGRSQRSPRLANSPRSRSGNRHRVDRIQEQHTNSRAYQAVGSSSHSPRPKPEPTVACASVFLPDSRRTSRGARRDPTWCGPGQTPDPHQSHASASSGPGAGSRPVRPLLGEPPARGSASCGGSIVMFGSTRSSQRGMYHDFSPSSVRKCRHERHPHDERVRQDRDREQQPELLRECDRR